MGFLVTLNGNTEIPTVAPVDLSGREPGAIEQNLRPHYPRVGRTGPDFASIRAVFNRLGKPIRSCRRCRMGCQHQNDCGCKSAFSIHIDEKAFAVPIPGILGLDTSGLPTISSGVISAKDIKNGATEANQNYRK